MESARFSPTFTGYVPGTQDALILFQAVLENKLPLITSRPSESARDQLIYSGAVFIFKESPVIKRWTDKISWSPSRVLGNFLVYRELNGKRARSDVTSSSLTRVDEFQRIRQGPAYDCPERGSNPEFSLYGSLLDSYDFKEGGLIKKTISTTYGDSTYRLVSYYTAEDVRSHKLMCPMDDPRLRDLQIAVELSQGIQFRMPLNSIPGYSSSSLADDLYEPHEPLEPLDPLEPLELLNMQMPNMVMQPMQYDNGEYIYQMQEQQQAPMSYSWC